MRFFGPNRKKENPTGAAIVLQTNYVAPPRNLNTYISEGYKQNVIVNRCIRQITQAISCIEIEVHKNGAPLEKHPVYELLRRPNPTESGPQFMSRIFVDYLIGGNIYIAQNPDSGKPKELWAQDQRYVKAFPGEKGLVKRYEYNSGSGVTITFPVDPVNGHCQLFHYKNYDPANQWQGLSPMEAATLAADAHNQGLRWNYSLLKNGARPSGIVKFKGAPTSEVVARLTEYFKKRFQGAANAGEIPMLTNDAEWQAIDTTPKDMDYINTLKETAKYIAAVYGVPLPLVDNDASTFNNIEGAKELLWTDTVIPLCSDFLVSFGNWLSVSYGEEIALKINMDGISALENMRTKKYNRMQGAVTNGVVSRDEARVALGYAPIGGLAESLFIPSSSIPLEMAGDVMGISDTSDLEDDQTDEDTRQYVRTLRSLNYSRKEIIDLLKIERA